MFRKLAVWTVVLMAVLSNDALALHQGHPSTPINGGNHMNDLYTANTKTPMATPPTTTTPDLPATPAVVAPAHENTTTTTLAGKTPSDSTTPSTSTPTTPTTSVGIVPLPVMPSSKASNVKKGSHVSDCNPNFPNEKLKEDPKAMHAVTPVTSDVKPATSTAKSTDHSVVTPAQATTTPTNVTDQLKTVSGKSKQTIQQVNTQSGNQGGETSTGMGAFAVVGLIAAVAAVGVAVSQVKKARDADADAALVTPGENENIHIEIKRTPAGGSTIL